MSSGMPQLASETADGRTTFSVGSNRHIELLWTLAFQEIFERQYPQRPAYAATPACPQACPTSLQETPVVKKHFQRARTIKKRGFQFLAFQGVPKQNTIRLGYVAIPPCLQARLNWLSRQHSPYAAKLNVLRVVPDWLSKWIKSCFWRTQAQEKRLLVSAF